ncbi:MAG: 5'-nucleotidase C-terminal domain-containing protein [bacterium]
MPTGGGCGWWRSPVGIATSVASSSTSTPKGTSRGSIPQRSASGRGRPGRRRGAAGSLGAGERRDPLREALATLADNEVGVTEVALDGRRAPLRAGETNLGDLVADALQWAVEELVFGTDDAPADVAIMNGGGIRINQVVPAGAVTELDTFSMLPFASFVVRLPAVSRDELKAVLENAFSQAEDGAGRFPQVAGMQIEWLPDGPARQLAPNGTVLQPGARVRRVVLDSGTVIVEDGVVRPGPPLVVATIDFLARGGDQYPFTGAFEAFGVSYQQALRDFIAGALEGRIDAADYPEGASDRIRRLR